MDDLISRQAAIATAVRAAIDWHRLANPQYSIAYCIGEAMRGLPSAQPDIYDYSDIEPLWESFAKEHDVNLTDGAKQLKDAMWVGYRKGKQDAQPEPQWIPCERELPEEYGEYEITWITSASKNRFIGICECEITSVWDAEHFRFKVEWLLDDYIKAYPDVKVLAWKPLDEPWRGEQP